MSHKLSLILKLDCYKKTCGRCQYLMGGFTECCLFLNDYFFNSLDHDKQGIPLRLKVCLDAEKIKTGSNFTTATVQEKK